MVRVRWLSLFIDNGTVFVHVVTMYGFGQYVRILYLAAASSLALRYAIKCMCFGIVEMAICAFPFHSHGYGFMVLCYYYVI